MGIRRGVIAGVLLAAGLGAAVASGQPSRTRTAPSFAVLGGGETGATPAPAEPPAALVEAQIAIPPLPAAFRRAVRARAGQLAGVSTLPEARMGTSLTEAGTSLEVVVGGPAVAGIRAEAARPGRVSDGWIVFDAEPVGARLIISFPYETAPPEPRVFELDCPVSRLRDASTTIPVTVSSFSQDSARGGIRETSTTRPELTGPGVGHVVALVRVPGQTHLAAIELDLRSVTLAMRACTLTRFR